MTISTLGVGSSSTRLNHGGDYVMAAEVVDTLDQHAVVAPTLGAHGGRQRGQTVRRLTLLECERLQGFPDGFSCLCQPLTAYAADPDGAALACRCPDSPRYRAMGNAVSVPVIIWLGRRLAQVADDLALRQAVDRAPFCPPGQRGEA